VTLPLVHFQNIFEDENPLLLAFRG